MRLPEGLLELTPLRIASLYAVVGLLWITFSDAVVLTTGASPLGISTIQTLKGGLFVAFSSGVILWLTSYREHQLQQSREQLEAASQRASVLQRIFRHNIRNDMNVVLGYIDIAQNEQLPDPAASDLDVAREKCGEIMDISEKLRIIDRYRMDAAPDEKIDMVPILESHVEDLRSMEPAPVVELDCPPTATIRGDSSVSYAIEEVLQNAVEHYDGRRDSLHLTIGVETRSDHVAVEIADTGPGIPPGELQALRDQTETDLVHLSSVGLWIVSWLCDRMDGDLSIETEKGEGTTVSLQFQRPVSMPSIGFDDRNLLSPVDGA